MGFDVEPAARERMAFTMANRKVVELVYETEGYCVVLQGNGAFALGCVRAGIHAVDGYPGTPSTEVIDKFLTHVQDRMLVGWSVNEANAVAMGFGHTMVGSDAVVTMKIPGLFQAADVVASVAGYTAPRGGLVLYVASDFTPSSTQYVFDPRYFLKSCFIPILEPRTHQEMYDSAALAAEIARKYSTPVAVLANGILCHSEGLVRLGPARKPPPLEPAPDFQRFMNMPEIARRNYEAIVATRLTGLRETAEISPLNHAEWNDRTSGVIVHGATQMVLREIWRSLRVKPSVLSLGMTFPLPLRLITGFAEKIQGPITVLGDGLRFLQEELAASGFRVEGKRTDSAITEWSPQAIAHHLGATLGNQAAPANLPAPVRRPPGICAGCPYRAFGLTVERLRKKRKVVASFGDIGCNTLLYFLKAIDTCTCMGAADTKRQGVVLSQPSLASKVISVTGDSTECHSGLDSTRNAVFRNVPGVKVILDNHTTAMTGGQPAPSSPVNLAGQPNRFVLEAALKAEGASVEVVDAYDADAIEQHLCSALDAAGTGQFTTLVVRGPCMQDVPSRDKRPRYTVVEDRCKKCGLCLVCPGIEQDPQGYPRFNHLCTGCGGRTGVCFQRCNQQALKLQPASTAPFNPPPPLPILQKIPASPVPGLPPSIRVAVRGVGGQGNLFVGKVLAEVAQLAGYSTVLKGETHGMAQLGGAVSSTFCCGEVASPVFMPGTSDTLLVMEESEVLRPGFLGLLRPEGTVLINRLRILPTGLASDDYPTWESISAALAGYEVITFDALQEARALGDEQGRSINVIALGLMSTVRPLDVIPSAIWQHALMGLSANEMVQRANLAAFTRGRQIRTADQRR